ncbi:sigma factor [Accumulibacter sp.]
MCEPITSLSRFSTWLFCIAHRRLIDHYRKQRRK